MTKQKSVRTPKYRRQKRRDSADQAIVELGGRRHYLGAYGSEESQEKYRPLVAEWMAAGGISNASKPLITVIEIIAAFWCHCERYYRRPDGTLTSEVDNFRQALRPLKSLYGHSLARDFGPVGLKALQEWMIKQEWCRTNINKQISRIRQVFKWAVAEQLVDPTVYHGLACVSALKRGRCEARERRKVAPVPTDHIDSIQPFVSRQVWALVQLQLITGARPGELVGLRAVDIDTSRDPWSYTPHLHKNSHRGHERTIGLGPRARSVLAPFMVDRALGAPLFSPRDAAREQHAAAPSHRRPNQAASIRRTSRCLGEQYTTSSYRRAIARACEEAFPHPSAELRRSTHPDGSRETAREFRARLTAEQRKELRAWTREHHWHPHQLRHNAGTEFRRLHGLEAAQVMLGHAKADVTQLYAEADREKAITLAAKFG